MLGFIRATYRTFKPQNNKWAGVVWARPLLMLILSAIAATISAKSAPQIYSQMATALTVLTGFTFTALFSDFALGQANLPKAENESDRQELLRLGRLSENFQIRVKFFIPLAIFEIVLISACGLFERVNGSEVSRIETVAILVAFFLFIECLYVFYRMAETIIVIVDIRRKYLIRRS